VSSDTPRDLRRPVFARTYRRVSERLEDEGMRELREELLAGLTGVVVEVGAGNGLTFARYPSTVERVVAVEPEPFLRRAAEAAAARAPVPVQVVPGRGDDLPLATGSADAVVLCLVLCSVRPRPQALAEVRRVLRPGGEVRFLEHTVAGTAGLRRVQRALDATLWPWFAGGCHLATDPVGDLTAAGFDVDRVRAFRFPAAGPTGPAGPHVLGRAVAP
jgi:SAM-dependent methyltransferase